MLTEQTSSSRYGGVLPDPPKKDESNKKNQKSVDSRVRFADDVKPASDVGSSDNIDVDSSNSFALEIHIAAHLQYLLVMSLRLTATLDYDTDEESFTDPHGSSDPATGSISFMEDGPGVDAWSGEESTLVYISDSERLHLEQMRLNEEAVESVPPSYEKDQWNGLDLLVDNPTREDSILQHFSSRQKESSRIESCRKSVRKLRQSLTKSHDEHLENAYLWRKIGLLQGEIFDETKDGDDLNQAIEAFLVVIEAWSVGHPDQWQNLADLSTRLVDKYKISRHKLDLDNALGITRRVIDTKDNPHELGDHYINLSYLHWCRYSETDAETDLMSAIQLARQAIEFVPEDSGKQAKYHNHLGQLLTLDYWRTGVETTIDEAIYELRVALGYIVEEDSEYSEYLATLSVALDKKFAMSGSQEQLDEAMQLMRKAIDLVTEHDSAFLRRLNCLGAMLGELYKKTGATDALEESIKIGRKVVASTPKNDIDVAERIENLAARLTDKFRRTGELILLDEAIDLSTTGKVLAPVQHSIVSHRQSVHP
ncbi:hypothetical protein IL306_007579 [Fusarium sp. DS 682]|nr:hypothetical protein IL306_007579 [Fusarium sp. DS 682]